MLAASAISITSLLLLVGPFGRKEAARQFEHHTAQVGAPADVSTQS